MGSVASAQIGGPVQFRQAAIEAVSVLDSGSSRFRMSGFRMVGRQDIGAAKARPSIAFAREIGSEKAVFRAARTEAVARVEGGPTTLGTVGNDRLHRIGTGSAQPNVAQVHAVAARQTGPQILHYAALSCVTASA